MFKVPNQYRVRNGLMGSDDAAGNNGMFVIQNKKLKTRLLMIASDQMGWEHVSVSTKHRTPNWREMSAVKDLFWGDDDLVVQLHPPKDNHINNHPYCLHLWRKSGTNDFCETPPILMV